MGTTTRRAITATVAAAVVGAAPLAGAAPAQAAAAGPRLIVRAVGAIDSGEPTWVSAYWTTGRDICGARVTATAPRVGVGYPANTADHSSFSRGAALARRTVDHTAFRLDAEDTARTRVTRLTLTMTYTELAGGALVPWAGDDDVDCRGAEKSVTTTALLVVNP
ncbi:hypothetical protein [Spirilliplanes yamanashiensis]|uniref:Uncharacterized protein n=1 Tax=Spirilliplanes yamanashiensis TaxID=42233 RepID=A0A8J3YDR5_9ACTN|nr:hypothetical protein [Spirilliplanes yamanashiensis]MDP9816301.1 hypothetical protein [Spirilliplanes yamanashiensis]GIJ05828.1 hypothetical protein Sya03_51800 [Spirilliplanes yamanashiensis]